MHSFDSDLTDLIFSYMRERLAMPEVPLDNPGDADDVQVALQGLLRAQGNSPAEVMKIYDEVISRTVISADSPRFLAFIPAAPTKAALLFDMVFAAHCRSSCYG